MEGETKTARIDQKSTFFYFFVFFFLKGQDIKKSKTLIFEMGSHKKFLGQVLTIFQTSLLLSSYLEISRSDSSFVNLFFKSVVQSLYYLVRHQIYSGNPKNNCNTTSLAYINTSIRLGVSAQGQLYA